MRRGSLVQDEIFVLPRFQSIEGVQGQLVQNVGLAGLGRQLGQGSYERLWIRHGRESFLDDEVGIVDAVGLDRRNFGLERRRNLRVGELLELVNLHGIRGRVCFRRQRIRRWIRCLGLGGLLWYQPGNVFPLVRIGGRIPRQRGLDFPLAPSPARSGLGAARERFVFGAVLENFRLVQRLGLFVFKAAI
jgi:hypothetical protein